MNSSYSAIIEQLKAQRYAPIYLLMGEEPYFIDSISNHIADCVLTESQQGFNRTVLYGGETTVDAIVENAKRYPVRSDYQLVIVREAQQLSSSIERLSAYAENPLASTLLVLDYKYKKLDARKKLYKLIEQNGVVFESKRLYEDKIPAWIASELRAKGYTIGEKASHLLGEFLGSDLSRIASELCKLALVVPKGQRITAEIVERNIGISKDYNNFELLKALGSRDLRKANQIVNYFGANPKNNPIAITLNLLYHFFTNLITYHTERDKSAQHISNKLGVSRFFVGDYRIASQNYHLKKAVQCISYIREADARSKGVGAVASHLGILRELTFKLLH
ncbi:MAG: DNA polymerase III subunit delta [Flavobacteriales bacterium]